MADWPGFGGGEGDDNYAAPTWPGFDAPAPPQGVDYMSLLQRLPGMGANALKALGSTAATIGGAAAEGAQRVGEGFHAGITEAGMLAGLYPEGYNPRDPTTGEQKPLPGVVKEAYWPRNDPSAPPIGADLIQLYRNLHGPGAEHLGAAARTATQLGAGFALDPASAGMAALEGPAGAVANAAVTLQSGAALPEQWKHYLDTAVREGFSPDAIEQGGEALAGTLMTAAGAHGVAREAAHGARDVFTVPPLGEPRPTAAGQPFDINPEAPNGGYGQGPVPDQLSRSVLTPQSPLEVRTDYRGTESLVGPAERLPRDPILRERGLPPPVPELGGNLLDQPLVPDPEVLLAARKARQAELQQRYPPPPEATPQTNTPAVPQEPLPGVDPALWQRYLEREAAQAAPPTPEAVPEPSVVPEAQPQSSSVEATGSPVVEGSTPSATAPQGQLLPDGKRMMGTNLQPPPNARAPKEFSGLDEAVDAIAAMPPAEAAAHMAGLESIGVPREMRDQIRREVQAKVAKVQNPVQLGGPEPTPVVTDYAPGSSTYQGPERRTEQRGPIPEWVPDPLKTRQEAANAAPPDVLAEAPGVPPGQPTPIPTDTLKPAPSGEVIPGADAARERYAKAQEAFRKGGTANVFVNPRTLADAVIVGADHIARGVRDFGQWSKAMVKEYGSEIKPHLQRIFKASSEKAGPAPPKTAKELAAAEKQAGPAARKAVEGIILSKRIATPDIGGFGQLRWMFGSHPREFIGSFAKAYAGLVPGLRKLVDTSWTPDPEFLTRVYKEEFQKSRLWKEAQRLGFDKHITLDPEVRSDPNLREDSLHDRPGLHKLVDKADQKLAMGYLQRGDNAYLYTTNKVRYDIWSKLYDQVKTKAAKEHWTPEKFDTEMKGVGDFVATGTGRGQVKGQGAFANLVRSSIPIMNTIGWSPRQLIARYQLLSGVYAKTLSPTARSMYLKSYRNNLLLGTALLTMAKMQGAEVGADPRNGDTFLQAKMGNVKWDIMQGYRSVIRTVMLNVMQAGKGFLPQKYQAKNVGDYNLRYLRGQLNPGVSMANNFFWGSDAIGNRADYTTALNNPFTKDNDVAWQLWHTMAPMTPRDIWEAGSELHKRGLLGDAMAVGGGLLQFGGVIGQSTRPAPYHRQH